MTDLARWAAAIAVTVLAVYQTWVVYKGYGHRLVLPVFRYGAGVLWIAAIYRTIVALGWTGDTPWIQNGTFNAFLTIFLALAVAVGALAGYQFTKRNGDDSLEHILKGE